ncbi:GNAT family N-acetyltransferase [Nanohaloarchaea archaeon H01]|nr:GNAT family N-acetyltransferase [Nanohaloarchaea archaeon H01]
MNDLEIKSGSELTSDELAKIPEAQLNAWPGDKVKHQIPAHFYQGHAEAIPINAAVLDGEVEGFSFMTKDESEEFPDEEGYYLHMLGVDQEVQKSGIGEKLMENQKQQADGEYIKWTFDPFEPVSSKLYVGKLGAQPSQFIPDKYSDDPDETPSHRFMAKWDIEESQDQSLASKLWSKPTGGSTNSEPIDQPSEYDIEWEEDQIETVMSYEDGEVQETDYLTEEDGEWQFDQQGIEESDSEFFSIEMPYDLEEVEDLTELKEAGAEVLDYMINEQDWKAVDYQTLEEGEKNAYIFESTELTAEKLFEQTPPPAPIR